MFVVDSWNPLGLCCLLRLVFWDLSAAHRDISWAVNKLHGKHVSCFSDVCLEKRIKHKKENSRDLFVCIWFPLAQKLFLVKIIIYYRRRVIWSKKDWELFSWEHLTVSQACVVCDMCFLENLAALAISCISSCLKGYFLEVFSLHNVINNFSGSLDIWKWRVLCLAAALTSESLQPAQLGPCCIKNLPASSEQWSTLVAPGVKHIQEGFGESCKKEIEHYRRWE